MRRSSAVALLAVLSLLPVSLLAQQGTQTSTTPQRDQQALSVLTQCLTAAGGAQAITAIQDYKATGTVTYFWAGQETTGTTTLQGRGVDQFRIDSALSSGNYSYIVSKGSGELKDIRGNTAHIPYHNAVTASNLSFPFAELAARLQDTSYNITYVGLVTKNGQQVHQIRTSKVLATTNATQEQTIVRLTTRDFFIDPQSFQVLGTQDMTHPNNNATQNFTHEILFSDYSVVNGVLVPLAITERIGGQQTWTIQLSQITFNVGLTDSDFAF
jgi:hypothetical protein